LTHNTSGFIGFWHTHPDMTSVQSTIDLTAMSELVSRMGENRRKAIMLIFGRKGERPTAGVYAYESTSFSSTCELLSVGIGQFLLESAVV
jgi:hypothetical protein